VQYSTVQYNIVQYNGVQYRKLCMVHSTYTVQYVQHISVPYSTTRHRTYITQSHRYTTQHPTQHHTQNTYTTQYNTAPHTTTHYTALHLLVIVSHCCLICTSPSRALLYKGAIINLDLICRKYSGISPIMKGILYEKSMKHNTLFAY
jgi:hypothetical protein